MDGRVVKYDSERCFGFIRPDGEEKDVFFHKKDLVDRDAAPKVGSRVRFSTAKGDKGPKAVQITVTAAAKTTPQSFFLGAAIFLGITSFILVKMYGHQPAWISALAAVNVTGLFLMGFDKGIAGGSSMRVPETVLWTTALIGGSAGIFLGMHTFRHKTQKASFQFVLLLIVAAQVAMLRLLKVI